MNPFYQSPAFLNAVAAAVIALLGVLFIGLRSFKPKKQIVVTPDPALWLAGDYYVYLSSVIKASRTIDQLNATMLLIDGFHDKEFRVPISRKVCNEYYTRLLEVYCKKENELTSIPLELCKN